MPMDTGVYFWQQDDRLLLFVTGRVTASEAYALYRHVDEWLKDHPDSTVFVDLGRTQYIDSTTIVTLIRLHKRLSDGHPGLVLCNLSEQVQEIIDQTKLTRFFSIISDEGMREIEGEALDNLPIRKKGDIDSSFVLDAHNNICEIVPELKPEFETLMKVLSGRVGGS